MMSSLILPPGYARLSGHQRPVPNPDVEARVRKELEAIDSLLDIRWVENVVYNERHDAYEGRYALTCNWPQGDARWGMVQKGELGAGATYDILGWFSPDMQDAGSGALDPSMIDSKVQELLAAADNSRMPWRDRMKTAAEKNIQHKKNMRKQFEENQAHDIASYERNRALGIHQVSVKEEIKK